MGFYAPLTHHSCSWLAAVVFICRQIAKSTCGTALTRKAGGDADVDWWAVVLLSLANHFHAFNCLFLIQFEITYFTVYFWHAVIYPHSNWCLVIYLFVFVFGDRDWTFDFIFNDLYNIFKCHKYAAFLNSFGVDTYVCVYVGLTHLFSLIDSSNANYKNMPTKLNAHSMYIHMYVCMYLCILFLSHLKSLMYSCLLYLIFLCPLAHRNSSDRGESLLKKFSGTNEIVIKNNWASEVIFNGNYLYALICINKWKYYIPTALLISISRCWWLLNKYRFKFKKASK